MYPYFVLLFGGMVFFVGVLRMNTAHDYVNYTPHAGHGGLVPLGLLLALMGVVWSLL